MCLILKVAILFAQYAFINKPTFSCISIFLVRKNKKYRITETKK